MTKIVFTDIDGDYNTPAMRQLADEAVDMTRVLAVRAVCEAHGALVVISSSWRANHPAEAQALGFPLHEDWRTESRPDRDRGLEVNEWLSRHPEVTQWVIIDDKNDFTGGAAISARVGHNGPCHSTGRFDQTDGAIVMTRSKDFKKQYAEAAQVCRAKGQITEAVMLETGAVEAVLNAIGKIGEEKINNEKLIGGLARVFAGVLMPLAAHAKTPMLRILLAGYIIQTMTSAMEDAAGPVIEHGEDLDAVKGLFTKGEWK